MLQVRSVKQGRRQGQITQVHLSWLDVGSDHQKQKQQYVMKLVIVNFYS